MRKIIKKIRELVDKRYPLFLLLIVLISYGQLVFMQPWEDDNALFFKLAHIEEGAGFLGRGPLGEGSYKYTATPYIPIYALFGYNTIPYFVLALVLYGLATLSLYYCSTKIFGKTVGKVTGFLFAAGYVASDGIIRLYNTLTTSLSLILISFWSLAYWKFLEKRDLKWYAAAVFSYWGLAEIIPSRTHYFIIVIIFFELFFLAFKKPIIKSALWSILRLTPFFGIFYYNFIQISDGRSGQVMVLIKGLLSGQFYLLYSFFSSLSNLFSPDWINTNVSYALSIFLICGLLVFIFRKHRIYFWIVSALTFIWLIFGKDFFRTPVLNIKANDLTSVIIGGLIFLSFTTLIVNFKNKLVRTVLFFFVLAISNIGAYAAYQPNVSYLTINRLLAHSFLGVCLIFGLAFDYLKGKNIWGKAMCFLIILYGLGNLFSAARYQNIILTSRSFPVRNFYSQLRSFVTKAKAGDTFYFDVADDSSLYFREAFSVAQMPEETAIAWRYGIDRYDIRRVTSFDELKRLIDSGQVSTPDIKAFFYKQGNLEDISQKLKESISNGQLTQELSLNPVEDGFEYELNKPIVSIVPQQVTVKIKATAQSDSKIEFPLIKDIRMISNSISDDLALRRVAFDYKSYLDSSADQMTATSSSQWQDRVVNHIIDKDFDTYWQADRILWQHESENFVINLNKVTKISSFAWINGLGNNTPTEYSIDVSTDNKNWHNVKKVSGVRRVDTKDVQVVSFPSVEARYIKMTITGTVGGDSPAVSEAWVVPDLYNNLDVDDVTKYFQSPFGYIKDKQTYLDTLKSTNYTGEVKILYKDNKHGDWVYDKSTNIKGVIYDGKFRSYKINFPAGGTEIYKIRIFETQVPGTIEFGNTLTVNGK